MAIGKRRPNSKSRPFPDAGDQPPQPRSPGHPFYEALGRALEEAGFDGFVRELVAPFYSPSPQGRPPISPGIYFRMLFVGYFEGLDSQRAISWRCSDSLSLRQFLGLSRGEETPDHSSLTRIRKRLPPDIHAEVFAFAMRTAREKGALSTKRLGVNSKYVEANAAMRTIVRLDATDDWTAYLARVARVEAHKAGEDHAAPGHASHAEHAPSDEGPGGSPYTTPAGSSEHAATGSRTLGETSAGMGMM